MRKETGREAIVSHFRASIEAKEAFLTARNIRGIETLSRWVFRALEAGKPVMLCGNGGSAADAQHIAAEMVGRFKRNRVPLPAIALGTNFSTLTCIGNDFEFEEIFSRPLEAYGKRGTVLIAFSTSGNSENIIRAVKKSRKMGIKTAGLTGKTGGKLASLVDVAFCVPSVSTATIQETHITIGHAVCQWVEERWRKNEA